MIADGIGGHHAGEIAAELAVDYITRGISESNGKKPLKILENSIQEASQAIAFKTVFSVTWSFRAIKEVESRNWRK